MEDGSEDVYSLICQIVLLAIVFYDVFLGPVWEVKFDGQVNMPQLRHTRVSLFLLFRGS